MVQVFAQTGQPIDADQKGSWDEDDNNGYQLLNEVGSGGTLSSLFTILSLFTEDVKMSWQDSEPAEGTIPDAIPEAFAKSFRNRGQRADSDVSQLSLNLEPESLVHPPRRTASLSSSGSTVHGARFDTTTSPRSHPSSRYESVLETPIGSGSPSLPHSFPRDVHTPTQLHHGVVARATEDTTLAVIPAEAFRRLTKKFPKATAHIVQGMQRRMPELLNRLINWIVILTRFSRVTFNAAHRYLGLTTEVLRTEKAINEIACHPLPPKFYESGGLQHLRQRFDGPGTTTHEESKGDQDYFKFIPKDASKGKSIFSKDKVTDSPKAIFSSPFRTSATRYEVQAGDLHSTAAPQLSEVYRPLTRTFSIANTPRMPHGRSSVVDDAQDGQPARLLGDEFDLRDEVMSCIAKSIGLLQPPLSGVESVEASPAFPATDFNRPNGAFNPSFGSLSLLDTADDTSSMTGSSSVNAGGYMSGLDNEVEILFFAAGSTLAKAGERNTGTFVHIPFTFRLLIHCFGIGLFYVIEGFLDILLPIEEKRTTQAKGSEACYRDHKLLFTVKPGGIAGYLGMSDRRHVFSALNP